MLKAVGWQSRPVFITSTFRDMHAERDWLRERVIPELEERLRERHAHLEPIDLRWGVENLSAEDEVAKELVVLKVCLDEIERSRPFLIGLIGDRYGWVPDPERMQSAVDEKGFETDVQEKSVTALEIEFGVLDSPDQRRRSHFFFRDPLPYQQMSPELAAQYSDAHSPDPGTRKHAEEHLQPLKQRIEDELPGRVHHYSVAWDADAQEVTGLDDFAAMVLEALWADLETEIPPLAEQEEITWEDQERLAFEEFIELAARDFVGREQIAAEMLALSRSPAAEGGTWGGCVTGLSGSGKSALLGYVARRLRDSTEHDGADMLLLSHFTGVTPRSQSVDAMLLRWIGELAEFLGEPSPVEEGASADELEEALASLLGRAALQTRVVVLLDAVNQFEPTTRAKHITWLPKLWPSNARLIATAIPCTASGALLERPGATEMPLERLPQPDAEEVVRRICARYHRTPHPDVIRALVNKRKPDGTPAAGNPLWLTLAVEELNLLDQDDFERADREFTGSGDQRMQQLLLSVVEELPPDVPGLYGWMLAHTEGTWGETWAQAFANVTALSRAGWRDSDYERLLPAVTGDAWDPATVAGLRRSFRGHLVRRGAQGQWDFAHSQTRPAIIRRNLGDAAEARRLHSLIADHLDTLPSEDQVHQSEMMYHLIGADDRTRAALYYGGALTEGELGGATQRLAEHVLASADGEGTRGLTWVTSLLAAPGLADTLVASVADRCMHDLRDAIENDARLDTRLALLEAVQATMVRLAAQEPGNTRWQRALASAHCYVGIVLVARGDLPGALEAYEAYRAGMERLAGQDPSNAVWQHDLASACSYVGTVLEAQGDLPGALEAYQAHRAGIERLAAQDLGNAVWQRDLAVSRIKLGEVRVAQGDLPGALSAYETSLGVFERLAAQDPGNATWQRDLAVNHANIGDVRVAQGDLPGALSAHEATLGIFERLAAQEPGNARWQRDLSLSLSRLGDVRVAQGDLPGAVSTYEATLDIAERLTAQDPGNAGWQRELSLSLIRLGAVRVAQGDLPGALSAFEASLDVAERLAAQDPGNAGWQGDLLASHSKVGDVRRAQGDLSGALRAYQASLEVAERLSAQDPGNAGWQNALSSARCCVGMVLHAQDDLAGALEAYEAYREGMERLSAQDPSNAMWQWGLSVAHCYVGMVMQAQGDLRGALGAYEAYREGMERLAAQDPGNAGWQRDLWVSYVEMGNITEATKPDEARSWYQQAYQTLLDMKQAGMHVSPEDEQFLQQLKQKLGR